MDTEPFAPWPLGYISPEDVAALTEVERLGLADIAHAYVTAVLRNRGVELEPWPQPPKAH
ncbi:hypothetical protein [Achromobacter denitrificans]|uniref:hypothetical protein n=1 Tax=Achromobacter denitrificans TaxID=32002 RepID=UPI0023E8419F|nr:hypothetical protein [Achromobacter denitrificans]MDF3850665.1 hypothetical protein [Achromobacter denitrificans]